MAKVTNLSKATEIVRINTEKGIVKGEILEAIVRELNVSRSNAFVYFTKASKILGGVETPKASKDAVAKVTKAVSANRSKKVAEIDAVIEGLKKSGAQVASPFAGLTA